MDLQLKNRPALVTGASIGIGNGIAKVLAAEGCRVAAVARRGDLLEELAAEIEAAGGARPHLIVEDLTTDGAAERIRDSVLGAFGHCDILVNNAGGSRPMSWDAGDAAWDEGMALNFEAVRRLTEAMVPSMLARKYGRVLSITGANEPTGVNAANAAKAALTVWSKAMSRVHAAEGLTFNCLPPGRINSEQILERLHPTPEARATYIKENIPAGYFGEPEDMAYLVAFLASPLARYITGEVIHVDGGSHRFAF